MNKPSYYSILPATVRYDSKLKPMEKIIYSEITALSNRWGYCSASNSYFAKLYDVSNETVSRWISNLQKQGYITCETVYDNNRIVERRIYIDNKINSSMTIKSSGTCENNHQPIDENIKDNITSRTLQDIIDINKDSDLYDYLNGGWMNELSVELCI